jgi:lycopene cyclase domain-containing protein
MSLYFILLLSSFSVPILLSFDKRLQFYKKWGVVLPAILIVGIVYIVFDIILTKNGVWGFNAKYLTGIYIFNLPLEECLFFLVIPYASLFLHYSIAEYFPNKKLGLKTNKALILVIIGFSIVMLLLNLEKQYTSYILSKLVVALLLIFFFKPEITQSFFVSFLVILVPFVIVNGILTGSFIQEEVVWYNNLENLGVRFFTIPVEDFAYALSMLLYNLLFIEFFKKPKIK